ncbi:hypothetical protein ABER99_21665 [Paenibacillus glucanolyticus]|jgi:hypothetical protein|uniref:Uncharacterized protein n=1 Tax=Paenibacillus glucanolyticus TaxID=59843 RepID=A0A163GS49_9BACL|nr:hypothetical protein [Paenibacillus glucanolyticus]KZS45122.1 hypothetical protein AWU65_03835 [Paenibacillus glucanolyticus]OMF65153.1 hypothetical protein BK142_31210 [Paenibacillus glucanolyticus]
MDVSLYEKGLLNQTVTWLNHLNLSVGYSYKIQIRFHNGTFTSSSIQYERMEWGGAISDKVIIAPVLRQLERKLQRVENTLIEIEIDLTTNIMGKIKDGGITVRSG